MTTNKSPSLSQLIKESGTEHIELSQLETLFHQLFEPYAKRAIEAIPIISINDQYTLYIDNLSIDVKQVTARVCNIVLNFKTNSENIPIAILQYRLNPGSKEYYFVKNGQMINPPNHLINQTYASTDEFYNHIKELITLFK